MPVRPTPRAPIQDVNNEAPILNAPTEETQNAEEVNGRERHKLIYWLAGTIMSLIAVAAVGGISYFLTAKVLTGATKKDVPIVRVVLPGTRLNQLWPAASGSPGSLDLNRQIFEGLVRFQGQNHLEPQLASSWNRASNTEWLFQLKSGIHFHNGHPLTAKVAAASLRADLDNTGLAVYSQGIADIQPVGDDLVKVTTKEPDPALPDKLTGLLIYDPASPGDAAGGTGPYTLKPGTKATAEHTRLAAVKGYYGGHIYTRELDITSAEAASVPDLYQQGAIDIGPVSYNSKLGSRAYQLLQAAPLTTWMLLPNATSGPAAKADVRRAVAAAIDTSALIKDGELAGSAAGQPLPTGVAGHSDSLARVPYSLPRAKQYLNSAGYARGVTLRLSYSADQSRTAALLRQQLNLAGVTLILLPNLNAPADLYLRSFTAYVPDGGDILNTALRSNLYSNPAVNTLLAQATTAFSSGTRASILQDASTKAMTDQAVIPLYDQAPDLYVVNPDFNFNRDVPGPGLGLYFQTLFMPK